MIPGIVQCYAHVGSSEAACFHDVVFEDERPVAGGGFGVDVCSAEES